MAKHAHVVVVEEIYRKRIIVTSDEEKFNADDAQETADALAHACCIDVTDDIPVERNCTTLHEASEEELRILPQYTDDIEAMMELLNN